MTHSSAHRFVICIRNDDYPAALETRKIYEVLSDPGASEHDQIRIVDEPGEEYLYPEAYFVAVKLPKAVEKALIEAA